MELNDRETFETSFQIENEAYLYTDGGDNITVHDDGDDYLDKDDGDDGPSNNELPSSVDDIPF